MSQRVGGVLKRFIPTTMEIVVGNKRYPCTLALFDNIRAHHQIGERVEIELNSQGQVKSLASREVEK